MHLCHVFAVESNIDWFEIITVRKHFYSHQKLCVLSRETDPEPRLSDLTCDDDLGIIGLHVTIIHSCSLSLPLLLGFLCIKRICIVLQDNQL